VTSASLCLFCGAEGDGDLPPGHEWGYPCPKRDQAPCPTCGATPGEPCTIADFASPRYGLPTRDHATRTSPSTPVDVLAPKTIGKVTDLTEYRRRRTG